MQSLLHHLVETCTKEEFIIIVLHLVLYRIMDVLIPARHVECVIEVYIILKFSFAP